MRYSTLRGKNWCRNSEMYGNGYSGSGWRVTRDCTKPKMFSWMSDKSRAINCVHRMSDTRDIPLFVAKLVLQFLKLYGNGYFGSGWRVTRDSMKQKVPSGYTNEKMLCNGANVITQFFNTSHKKGGMKFFSWTTICLKICSRKNPAFFWPLKGLKNYILGARGNVTDGGQPAWAVEASCL